MGGGEELVGVRITTGLGNQLFQYAAGFALARRLGRKLVCDLSYYRWNGHASRRLQLRDFGIVLEGARIAPFRAPLTRFLVAHGVLHRRMADAEPFRQNWYDPQFETLEAPRIALSGYLQSWRYFAGHEAALRQVYATDRLATARTQGIAREIAAAANPVAVHVRLGDYRKSPRMMARFAILSPAYYQAARARLAAEVPDPTYFLFSDEPERARAELGDWPKLRVVSGHSGLEDFYLMSLCRHFIIANSTYSWWAAWLGAAADKQVVAPDKWFGLGHARQAELNMDDRLPPDWLRVPVTLPSLPEGLSR